MVEILLKSEGILINMSHCTPLYLAASNGCEKIVELLLNVEAIEINAQDDDGDTPLFVAAKMGHHNVVKMLLEKENIEVNLANWEGDTPLSVAADERNGKIVHLLLRTEAIRAIGWNGWRPIANPA